MTKDDLLERVAFWQVGLMDVDHLRDVAFEALECDLDCTEFRVIAGDSRLQPEDARDMLERALRAVGMEPPDQRRAERIVCVSVARSILAGAIEPMWGAGLISRYTHDEHPSPVFGPLLTGSCWCCNGLDGMEGPGERAKRKVELRGILMDHLRESLPAIRAWAGQEAPPGLSMPSGPGFLGWRRNPETRRESSSNLEKRVDEILFHVWDPIGVSHAPEARDEYSGYVPQVLRILQSGSAVGQVAGPLREYLRSLEVDGMGLTDDARARCRREVAIQELVALLG